VVFFESVSQAVCSAETINKEICGCMGMMMMKMMIIYTFAPESMEMFFEYAQSKGVRRRSGKFFFGVWISWWGDDGVGMRMCARR
jgi:hypothetical protein